MSKETETSELDRLAEPHGPDLTGQSPVVHERFDESAGRAECNEDYIVFLDGMEKALIGTADVGGTQVAVYERELCIQCLMENYGPNWADACGDYTEEQKADEEFMRSELYTMAVEDFEYNTLRALPYQHEHAPIIVEGFCVDSERWTGFKDA